MKWGVGGRWVLLSWNFSIGQTGHTIGFVLSVWVVNTLCSAEVPTLNPWGLPGKCLLGNQAYVVPYGLTSHTDLVVVVLKQRHIRVLPKAGN